MSLEHKKNLENTDIYGKTPRGGAFIQLIAESSFPELSESGRIKKLDEIYRNLTEEFDKLYKQLTEKPDKLIGENATDKSDNQERIEKIKSTYNSLKDKAQAFRLDASGESDVKKFFGPPYSSNEKKAGLSGYKQNIHDLEKTLIDLQETSKNIEDKAIPPESKSNQQQDKKQADELDKLIDRLTKQFIESSERHRDERMQKFYSLYQETTRYVDKLMDKLKDAGFERTEAGATIEKIEKDYNGLKDNIKNARTFASTKLNIWLEQVIQSHLEHERMKGEDTSINLDGGETQEKNGPSLESENTTDIPTSASNKPKHWFRKAVRFYYRKERNAIESTYIASISKVLKLGFEIRDEIKKIDEKNTQKNVVYSHNEISINADNIMTNIATKNNDLQKEILIDNDNITTITATKNIAAIPSIQIKETSKNSIIEINDNDIIEENIISLEKVENEQSSNNIEETYKITKTTNDDNIIINVNQQTFQSTNIENDTSDKSDAEHDNISDDSGLIRRIGTVLGFGIDKFAYKITPRSWLEWNTPEIPQKKAKSFVSPESELRRAMKRTKELIQGYELSLNQTSQLLSSHEKLKEQVDLQKAWDRLDQTRKVFHTISVTINKLSENGQLTEQAMLESSKILRTWRAKLSEIKEDMQEIKLLVTEWHDSRNQMLRAYTSSGSKDTPSEESRTDSEKDKVQELIQKKQELEKLLKSTGDALEQEKNKIEEPEKQLKSTKDAPIGEILIDFEKNEVQEPIQKKQNLEELLKSTEDALDDIIYKSARSRMTKLDSFPMTKIYNIAADFIPFRNHIPGLKRDPLKPLEFGVSGAKEELWTTASMVEDNIKKMALSFERFNELFLIGGKLKDLEQSRTLSRKGASLESTEGILTTMLQEISKEQLKSWDYLTTPGIEKIITKMLEAQEHINKARKYSESGNTTIKELLKRANTLSADNAKLHGIWLALEERKHQKLVNPRSQLEELMQPTKKARKFNKELLNTITDLQSTLEKINTNEKGNTPNYELEEIIMHKGGKLEKDTSIENVTDHIENTVYKEENTNEENNTDKEENTNEESNIKIDLQEVKDRLNQAKNDFEVAKRQLRWGQGTGEASRWENYLPLRWLYHALPGYGNLEMKTFLQSSKVLRTNIAELSKIWAEMEAVPDRLKEAGFSSPQIIAASDKLRVMFEQQRESIAKKLEKYEQLWQNNPDAKKSDLGVLQVKLMLWDTALMVKNNIENWMLSFKQLNGLSQQGDKSENLDQFEDIAKQEISAASIKSIQEASIKTSEKPTVSDKKISAISIEDIIAMSDEISNEFKLPSSDEISNEFESSDVENPQNINIENSDNYITPDINKITKIIKAISGILEALEYSISDEATTEGLLERTDTLSTNNEQLFLSWVELHKEKPLANSDILEPVHLAVEGSKLTEDKHDLHKDLQELSKQLEPLLNNKELQYKDLQKLGKQFESLLGIEKWQPIKEVLDDISNLEAKLPENLRTKLDAGRYGKRKQEFAKQKEKFVEEIANEKNNTSNHKGKTKPIEIRIETELREIGDLLQQEMFKVFPKNENEYEENIVLLRKQCGHLFSKMPAEVKKEIDTSESAKKFFDNRLKLLKDYFNFDAENEERKGLTSEIETNLKETYELMLEKLPLQRRDNDDPSNTPQLKLLLTVNEASSPKDIDTKIQQSDMFEHINELIDKIDKIESKLIENGASPERIRLKFEKHIKEYKTYIKNLEKEDMNQDKNMQQPLENLKENLLKAQINFYKTRIGDLEKENEKNVERIRNLKEYISKAEEE